MYKFLTKYGQTAALLLGVLIVLIFLITVSSGLSSAGYDMSTDLNGLPDDAKAAINFFNPTIAITGFLAILTGFLAFVAFGVWDLIKFPKSAIKFLIGLAVLLVVFFILYSTADPSVSEAFQGKYEENNITDTISKFISAGTITAVGLVLIAAVLMILGAIRNAFK